ncbi:MAG: cobalamin-dependent protein [Candidatus Heimdallarchaeota archaeon]
MKHYDLIFIHPPRLLKPDYGRVVKFIRGAFIFIPMGVFAIGDKLKKEGFGVKIINYPLEQYLEKNWNLKTYLKSIDFDVCAIDLHWIHHSHGAIEVSKIVKNINPNAKIVLGGFSASYYHREILEYYPSIDGIVRGEGEIPLLKYVENINHNSFDSVPNLSYRDSSKHIKKNPLSYVAKDLDDLEFTNVSLLKNAKKYLECSRKLMGISFNLPIGRGCPFNCPLCGGGQRAQQSYMGRESVILRSPEKIVNDIHKISSKYKIPSVFFGHGSYQSNLKYWKRLFGLIQKESFDLGGDLEIWRLPFPKEMWKIFYKTFIRRYSSISISPRTISPKVHQKVAKVCDPTFRFPENQINDLIKNANLFRMILRIWLTIGYPFQTRLDFVNDFKFAMKCLFKYGKSTAKPITIMNEPYFAFPGSPAFQFPEKFGIHFRYHSFPEIVYAFKQAKISSLNNVINYNTKYFSGMDIHRLNRLFFLSTAPMFLTTGSKKP